MYFQKKKSQNRKFTKKFIETIDEFAETYLEKLLRIRIRSVILVLSLMLIMVKQL